MLNRSIKLVFMFSLLATGIFNSCSKKDLNKATITTCDNGEAVINELTDETGIFNINELTNRPAINVHTPGSIDEVSVYLICNPTFDLPKEKKEVTFTGKVRKSKQISNIGGLTYYELEIEKIN